MFFSLNLDKWITIQEVTHTHNVIQFEGSLYGKENLIFATRIITSRGSWRSPQIAKIAVTFDTWGAGGGDASVKADWKSRESLLVSSFSIELKSFESFSIWRWVAGNLAKGTLHLHLPTFGNKIVHFLVEISKTACAPLRLGVISNKDSRTAAGIHTNASRRGENNASSWKQGFAEEHIYVQINDLVESSLNIDLPQHTLL